QLDAPFAAKRRRTQIACLNCRKKKLRCISTQEYPTSPCTRCTRKRIRCEYSETSGAIVNRTGSHGQSAQFINLDPSAMSSSPLGQASTSAERSPRDTPSASPHHSDQRLSSSPQQQGDALLPPPHTAPRPLDLHTRYAGALYPDLSFSDPSTPAPIPSEAPIWRPAMEDLAFLASYPYPESHPSTSSPPHHPSDYGHSNVPRCPVDHSPLDPSAMHIQPQPQPLAYAPLQLDLSVPSFVHPSVLQNAIEENIAAWLDVCDWECGFIGQG
ncbi:hypothetical protein C8R47DRAFT_1295087, partial [Mycena vitilis]